MEARAELRQLRRARSSSFCSFLYTKGIARGHEPVHKDAGKKRGSVSGSGSSLPRRGSKEMAAAVCGSGELQLEQPDGDWTRVFGGNEEERQGII